MHGRKLEFVKIGANQTDRRQHVSGRSETERERRQRLQRQRGEKCLKMKRRARRRRILFQLCVVAVAIVLLVNYRALEGKLRRYFRHAGAGISVSEQSISFRKGDSQGTVSGLSTEIYPESLLELLEKNPEAEQFVLNYPKNKDTHLEIDLTDEVTEGTIPLFIQWDERWGYETYGGDFLAVTGCGPTCLSMVYCGLKGDTKWNPLSVAQWAEQEGYYVKGAGSSWDLMTYGAKNLGLLQENVVFDAEHILRSLNNGNPIICVMRPGDFTTSGHFIVLAGVDENGKVIVRDPNSKVNSDKTWAVEDLMPQIKNLWGYLG